MTGGSLGLRSASYGSLQNQNLQNGLLLSSQFPLPPPPPPLFVPRRPATMLKEKERFVSRICKFAGRKKVGMLFLCVVSAAVFGWVLYFGKGEDPSEDDHASSIRLNNQTALSYETSTYGLQHPSSVYFTGYVLPPGNPCENFVLPPPPADKKRTGPRPCPVCYLPVEEAITLMPKAPSYSPVLHNLTYVYAEHLLKTEFGGSEFGGYPSLKQRNDSFNIKESMTVHCGFVKGTKPGRGTGYDIDDADLLDMEQCNGIVVASAIFGNFDLLREPKNISEAAQKSVCFYMFLDEETEAYMRNTSILDGRKKVGLWRIVLVRNLPYADPRRNGKVPKLLLHRLFPNVRYSIWMDGKLELVVDPYQILERFLWRKNASFAISRHYRRFDVFVEAEANKAAAKYDNSSIDFQIEFYKQEGLTPYSEVKLPFTSDVPEGCVIIREHIPISNLFTCLWFNEVDRFTSRDQLSFSIVRDKIMAKVNWSISMFLDCERRNFVVQGYHRMF
ncbi:Probable hexosyltransferase muci70 [Ancistrocladus abbreviatus]